ncbi:MAG: (d)CMP kinase [Thermomicrobiales bacterium]|nr:(d)CMP kinase [Thermomicrobiales bacterium]
MTAEESRQLPVIAIDGPAASGKSTIARGVARELGIQSFDTGLLYRAAAWLARERSIAPSDAPALVAALESTPIELSPEGDVLLGGSNVSPYLRTPEVEAIVSEVAAHPAVRGSLLQAQRTIAESTPVVMVGRDITTVVVPDAAVRVYLDASVEERARRRLKDRQAVDPTATFEVVLAEIRERDLKDSTRETAPLMAAEGVTVVDTDDQTIAQVVDTVVGMARASGHTAFAIAESPDSSESLPVPEQYLEGSRHSRKRQTAGALNGWWIKLISRIRTVGDENIPPWGPLLYVSNHLHNLDPALEYYVFPRPIHFMGKQELFQYPVVKQIAEASGGFPVDRGKVDREALRNADDRINRGIPLGIYPEGGRSPNGAMIEGKAGAGMLALKSGAPILPVAITGSERLPLNGGKGKSQRRAAQRDPGHEGVRVTYGAPFTIPRIFEGTKIGADEATEIIMLEIARLLPEDYRGFYADKLREQTVRKIIPYSSSKMTSTSSSPAKSSSPKP